MVAVMAQGASAVVAQLKNVRLHYGKTEALRGLTLDIPAGGMVGLIGPDGVGKSSLLSLLSGARRVQEGEVWALGGDMASRAHRDAVCPRIAYMPQVWARTSTPRCRWKKTCSSSPACLATTKLSAVPALMI